VAFCVSFGLVEAAVSSLWVWFDPASPLVWWVGCGSDVLSDDEETTAPDDGPDVWLAASLLDAVLGVALETTAASLEAAADGWTASLAVSFRATLAADSVPGSFELPASFPDALDTSTEDALPCEGGSAAGGAVATATAAMPTTTINKCHERRNGIIALRQGKDVNPGRYSASNHVDW